MRDNWQQAPDLARDKGLIRRNERRWGQRVLIKNTMLAKKMDSMLRANFFVLMAPLPVFLFRAKRTVWKHLNGVLHCWARHLHQKIRRILGWTHDGGTYART